MHNDWTRTFKEMNNDWARTFKEVVVVQFEVLSQNLPAKTEENDRIRQSG
jgi:hypothetical protein